MPADNGSGCHLDERFLPFIPEPSQYDPEQLVPCRESSARSLAVQSEELLTQGEVFQDEILAGTKGTAKPAEEVPEPYDHAQNLTGTLPIELGAKSLILRVYDVLMNDRSGIRLLTHREQRKTRWAPLRAFRRVLHHRAANAPAGARGCAVDATT